MRKTKMPRYNWVDTELMNIVDAETSMLVEENVSRPLNILLNKNVLHRAFKFFPGYNVSAELSRFSRSLKREIKSELEDLFFIRINRKKKSK